MSSQRSTYRRSAQQHSNSACTPNYPSMSSHHASRRQLFADSAQFVNVGVADQEVRGSIERPTSLTNSSVASFYGPVRRQYSSQIAGRSSLHQGSSWMPATDCLEELDISGDEYDGSQDESQHVRNQSQCRSVNDGSLNARVRADLWEDIKQLLTREFAEVHKTIDAINNRIDGLENKLTELQSADITSSSGSDSTPTVQRKRKSALGTQSKIRAVHRSMNEANQLHVDEPIDSIHNKKVIEAIHVQVGGDISSIRAGVNVYRKTLKRADHDEEASKRAKRSRKQRLWDRRSKHLVGESETQKWEDITVNDMSDEEVLSDGFIKRKPPSWRSAELNELLRLLDSRADTNLKSARKPRVEGSPLKVAPPNGCPQWMVAPEQ